MSGVNSGGADFMLPCSCKQWKGKGEELTQSLDYSLWMNIHQWHSASPAATQPPNSTSLCEPQAAVPAAKQVLLALRLFALVWVSDKHQNESGAPRDRYLELGLPTGAAAGSLLRQADTIA